MSILTPILDLNPASGDTSPKNTVGGATVLGTGAGTLTLVAGSGAGRFAWRLSGGDRSSAWAPSIPVSLSSGSGDPGVTMAARIRLSASDVGGANNQSWLGIGQDLTRQNQLNVRRTGGGMTLQPSFMAQETAAPVSAVDDATFVTVVIRVTANDAARSSLDYIEVWFQGQSGVAPVTSANGNLGGGTIAYLAASVTGTAAIDIERWVVWREMLSNAQCAALAQDVFAALSAPPPLAFAGSVPAQAGTVSVASAALALAGYFTGGTAPLGYAVFSGALPGGLSLNASTGAITGTPTAAGSFSAVVRATDAASATANTGTIAWTIAAAAATALQVVGPSGGQSGVSSGTITITANGTLAASKTITASDGASGTITFASGPTLVSGGSVTCTYTPSSAGAKTVTFSTSDASLTAATLSYTSSAVAGRLLFTANPADICRAFGSGSVIASTPATMWVHNATTGDKIAQLSVTTDAAGLFGAITNGALALNTLYRIDYKFSTGEYGSVYRTSEAT